MAEEILIPVELDTSPAEQAFKRLAQSAERVLSRSLSRDALATSSALERLGTELERTTDGFDRFRSAADAQIDRLRLFGEAGELAAAQIERMSDPLARVAAAQATFNRLSSPNVLQRAATGVNDLSAQYQLLRQRLGVLPALLQGLGRGVGVFGAAAAGAFGIAAAGVKKFFDANDQTERQMKALTRALDQLVVTTVNAATGGSLPRLFKEAEKAVERLTGAVERNREVIFDFAKDTASAFVTMGEVIGKVFLGLEALVSSSLASGEMALGRLISGVKGLQIAMAEGQLTRLKEAEANFKLAQETYNAAIDLQLSGAGGGKAKADLAGAELETARQILGVERNRAREAKASVDALKQERAAAERLIGGGERGLMGAANHLDAFSAAMDGLRAKIEGMADTGAKAPRVKGEGGGGDGKVTSAMSAAMGRVGQAQGGAFTGLAPLGMTERAGSGSPVTLAQQGQQLAAAWASAKPAFEQAAEAQARLVQEGLRFDGMVGTVSLLTDGFASLGGQVAETLGVFAAGGGTLKGFGDAMLDAFGGLASQIGDFYLKLGIAMLAVGDPLGLGAIAGGLGLKALGGALGQKGSGNAKRGGGGRGAGPSSGDLTSRLPRDPRRGEQGSTTVNVIIDGDKVASSTGERARLGHLTLSPYAPRGARS